MIGAARGESGRIIPSEQFLYYVDDEMMPPSETEQHIYLMKSRAVLIAEVIDTYAFIRTHGLADEYMSWKKGYSGQAVISSGCTCTDLQHLP